MEYYMDLLSILMWMVPVGAIVLPIVLARRGVGSRWVWIGGGIGGLVGLILYFYVWHMAQQPPSHVDSGFGPIIICPPSMPLGGADGTCVLCALAFMVAGICYKPKKQAETTLGKM